MLLKETFLFLCKVCLFCDSINDIDIEFLDKCLDPLGATLTEARQIDSLNPNLNRRH